MTAHTTPHRIRLFAASILLTLALAVFVLVTRGFGELWTFLILVILEVTFSFDNAVVNSKILARMSAFWQQLFLTVGIIFAVVVVRFVLPVILVMISAHTSFSRVLDLALHDAGTYGTMLQQAAPMINAFGGSFLLMIGLSYFLDRGKEVHWLTHIETWLKKFGEYGSVKVLIMLLVALALFATVSHSVQVVVLVAALCGITLHITLDLFSTYFNDRQPHHTTLVGMAAFVSFVYLNILDASFSLDGVVGAFAITNNILIIMAGLGAGALWVRSFTIYLVRTNKLATYQYLEHGAHWAILLLGAVMFMKLYHIELPEWATGLIGLVCIMAAVASSVIERRRRH